MKKQQLLYSSEEPLNNACRSRFWPGLWHRALIQTLAVVALATNGQVQIRAKEFMSTNGPVKVELIQTNDCYQLYVDHKPFYIKGAGLESGNQAKLAEHGGNSIRTWRTENGRASGQQLLNSAFKNKLYVTMGLEIERERHGFDYNDKTAVARQLERVKAEVLKYKDDPALIIWAIGNELNLDAKNPKVWDAVNDISKMIHQIDTNHLTTTPLAGFKQDLVRQVKTRAPDLDLLSFQMYADIVNLPRYLRESDWNGPYMVTEWGATGHWEIPKTDWGAPIENDSTTKADFYQKRFEAVIQADQKQCVGSYVFLWGHKQERTPTWYGIYGVWCRSNSIFPVPCWKVRGKLPAAPASTLTSKPRGKCALCRRSLKKVSCALTMRRSPMSSNTPARLP